MQTQPITDCRVLELGCASGTNLLPMAVEFPDAEFVGVDLGAEQIAQMASAVDELGLGNIRCIHGDLLDLDS